MLRHSESHLISYLFDPSQRMFVPSSGERQALERVEKEFHHHQPALMSADTQSKSLVNCWKLGEN